MQSESSPQALQVAPPARRYFTLEQAESALVLVRRIVRDIVRRHAELLRLRDEIEDLGDTAATADAVAALRVRGEQLASALNRLHDELLEIGCELKDWTVGLVDFPALREGREVLLCWRLDEDAVRHWHEPDAGFSGRQPIDDSF